MSAIAIAYGTAIGCACLISEYVIFIVLCVVKDVIMMMK